MEEGKIDKKGASGKYITMVKRNPWIAASVILAIILVVLLVMKFTGVGGVSETTIKSNLVSFAKAQGVDLTVNSIAKEGALYKVTVTVNGQTAPVYVTLDGQYLVNGILPLSPSGTTGTTGNTNTATTIPKSDKPKVEIFVMSFCPYGIQGEKLMKPVYDILSSKVDFSIKYFATPQGTKIDDIQSLHGVLEAEEDARQICIAKLFPAKLWNYVSAFDSNCGSDSKDATALDTCWKAAAASSSILSAEVISCTQSAQPIIDRINADGALVQSYGLSGSESVVINGVLVSPSQYRWDTNKLKNLICSAFNTAPAECAQALTGSSATSAAATAGSCS